MSLGYRTYNPSGQGKRSIVRIQIRIPAKILAAGHPFKGVCLNEISSRGLSFNVDKSDDIPDSFIIRFRLRAFSKPIKVKVRVESRKDAPEEGLVRIGCSFSEIPKEDRDLIVGYLGRYVDFYLPRIIVSTAAFLLSCDALSRILAYSVNFYYNRTDLGKNFQTIYDQDFYGFMLLLYAFNAFSAFIFSERIIKRQTRRDFLLSILYLIPALIYILIKNIMYWQFGLWLDEHLFIRIFLWAQVLVIAFTGYAIWSGIFLLKRIDAVSDSIDSHIPISRQINIQ